MANLVDTIQNLDLSKAVSALTQKAKDTVSSTASDALSKVSSVSDAFAAAGQMKEELQQDVQAAVTAAKTYAVATLALQAIAAFAAVGIFLVQVKAYGDSQSRRRAPRMPYPRPRRGIGGRMRSRAGKALSRGRTR